MNDVENHLTIFNVSEQLDNSLKGLKRAVQNANLYAEDAVAILIWVAGIEGVADYAREKANELAEVQP